MNLSVDDLRRAYTPESVEACGNAFIAGVKKGCLSDEDYAREYLCEPAKLAQLVSAAEYDRCLLKDPVPDFLDPNRRYNDLYVGIDLGRSHDLTVVWVNETGFDPKAPPHLATVFRPVCILAMRNTPFPVQEARIRPIVSHPAVCKGFVDQGSIGRGLAESIRDETGNVVEMFAFTAPRKEAICERVRQFVQGQRQGLPDDQQIRRDILSMRRDKTPNGSFTYKGGTTYSHGDYFCGLGLALEAAQGACRVEIIDPEPEVLLAS